MMHAYSMYRNYSSKGSRSSSIRARQSGEDEVVVIEEDYPASGDAAPKKKLFTGRCRLFVGGTPLDMKEDDLRELFKPYGQIGETFVSSRGFAFVRMVC